MVLTFTYSNEHKPAGAFVAPRTTSASSIEKPLTAQELAETIPLHPVTILPWAREGRIPHSRLSARKIVFIRSEIEKWLLGRYTGPAVRAA